MSTATDTIVCPKCGGEMLVGVMPTDSDATVSVHGICQACDCHFSNSITTDAPLRHLLSNHAWIMGQFRQSVQRYGSTK